MKRTPLPVPNVPQPLAPAVVAAGILALAAIAIPDRPARANDFELKQLIKCQNAIARAGARFAFTTVKKTLKCTNEIVECEVECEEGVFGACDPDDPGSNQQYQACLNTANEVCVKQNQLIDTAEVRKRAKITNACDQLTEEQLCGAETTGLNFIALNAGCEEIIPGYVCNLTNLLDCVGGPRQQALAEEISGLLDPRAGEALQLAGVSTFGGIARTRKVAETLAPGKVDVWSISGQADQIIKVRVKTRDDVAGTSNLQPKLTYISLDGTTPVANTAVVEVPCPVPNSCGQPCEAFKRRFPFSGTFFLAVESDTTAGCGGGSYQLVVTTPGASNPTLVANDVDPMFP